MPGRSPRDWRRALVLESDSDADDEAEAAPAPTAAGKRPRASAGPSDAEAAADDDGVQLPCEFCGKMLPAEQLDSHQRRCEFVEAREPDPVDVEEEPAVGGSPASVGLERVPCEFCQIPQPLARLTRHEQFCPQRHSAAPPEHAASSQARAPAPYAARSNATGGSQAGGSQAGGSQAGGSQSQAQALAAARAAAQAAAAPASAPPSGARSAPTGGSSVQSRWARALEQEEDDDIEELSDDSGEWQPAARRQSTAQSADAPPPSSMAHAQPSPHAHLFPHFVSLQSLRDRQELTHIDYLGQVGLDGGGGTRPRQPGSSSVGVAGGKAAKRAAGGATGKRKRKAAAPRNSWRTKGGRRVYYDEDGKQSTGSAAFQKHKKHQAAAN